MQTHTFRNRAGQLRTVFIHRPLGEIDIVNRACRRHARRHDTRVIHGTSAFCNNRNKRPEWLKREHVATDAFMQAQRARRAGNYSRARMILADLAQWRKRNANARA